MTNFTKEGYVKYDELISIRIQNEKDNASLYKNRGLARHHLERFSEAVLDYSKAIELNPRDHTVFRYLGDVYGKLGEYSKAIQEYTNSIELNASDYAVFQNRGSKYMELKQYVKAIEDFSKTIELNPYFHSAYFNRGKCYQDLGYIEKAIADYTKSIELNPRDPFSFIYRGFCYQGLEMYENSIQDYSKTIELDPLNHSAFNNRGNVFHNMEKYTEAVRDFTKAIQIKPLDASAHVNRGNSYFHVGNFQLALQDFSRAIELNPTIHVVFKNRGVTYEELKMFKHALQDYSKAIELNPKDPDVHNSRGKVFGGDEIREFGKSIHDFSKAIELNPNYYDAFFNRGALYHYLNKLDPTTGEHDYLKLALHDFNECIRLNPREAKSYHVRGKVYNSMGDKGKAETDRKTAEEIDDGYLSTLRNPVEDDKFDAFGMELVELQKRLEHVRYDDLTILKRLGSGAFGLTYLCRVSKGVMIEGREQLFVVKIYRTIKTAKKMKEYLDRDSLYLQYHPNLVTILAHCENEVIETKTLPDYETYWEPREIDLLEDVPMILMKYYPADLKSFLENVKKIISTLKICLILQGIINGAHFLHKKMIVHRDLHPGNILFDERSNHVWICDFGCALDLRSNRGKFEVKKDDEMMFSYQSSFSNTYDRNYLKIGGAKHFRPPEIIELGERTDVETFDYSKFDIYSIGVIGKRLLQKSSEEEKEYERVSKFIDRFLEADPTRRIDFEEAVNGIRKLIFKIQADTKGEDSSSPSSEEEEEGDDDDDEEDLLREAIKLSLQDAV